MKKAFVAFGAAIGLVLMFAAPALAHAVDSLNVDCSGVSVNVVSFPKNATSTLSVTIDGTAGSTTVHSNGSGKGTSGTVAWPGSVSSGETVSIHITWTVDGGGSFTGTVKKPANCDDTVSVTLCHATGSDSNPFVSITTDASGAYNGHYGSGHQDGEDIIPPFVYNGVTYSQNWDATGQAIYNNGCKPPVVDVCPNLEGAQQTVPDGYELNNDGQCVIIPTPTPTPTETPPPPPCEQTEAGCPTETPPPPPPSNPNAFIFSTCDGTFVRFVGTGNGYYSVDGVFTDVTITVDPTDIQLGNLPNGTVVTAAFNGGEVKTLTVDNSNCGGTVTPPPPTSPPPPWSPSWSPHPAIPTHTLSPGGGSLAFTGAPSSTVPLVLKILALVTLGLGCLYVARRRDIRRLEGKQ